jgi:hypothetical protein
LTAKIIANDVEIAVKAKSMNIDWLMLLKFNQALYVSVDMSWLDVMMMIVYCLIKKNRCMFITCIYV